MTNPQLTHPRRPAVAVVIGALALVLAAPAACSSSSGSSSAKSGTTTTTSPKPAEGEDCGTYEYYACGADAGDAIDVFVCKGGTWKKAGQCPSMQGCGAMPDGYICGAHMSFANLGSACATDGNQACSADKKTVLVCNAGEWVEGIHCPPTECTYVHSIDPSDPGKGGCQGMWCSNCGSSVGDRCAFQAGLVNCSTDLKSLLACANGTTVVEKDCGSQNCAVVYQDGHYGYTCE